MYDFPEKNKKRALTRYHMFKARAKEQKINHKKGKYYMPEQDTNQYYTFLEELNEWGVADMTRAGPYLQEKFPELDMAQARRIIHEWMSTKRQLLNESYAH